MEATLDGYDGWDAPLRLLGAVHFLALSGRAPSAFDGWDEFHSVLSEHRETLARLVRSRGVQTNEVQRSWTLVPCFLELARRTGVAVLDLVELGASAGLNLVWDRYRYRYRLGEWGPQEAELVLSGEERGTVPGELVGVDVRVGRRTGVDLNPIDVTTDEGALTLKSFVWVGQDERLDRLDRAIEALRKDPPEIVRGDFVELLPSLLAARRSDALTVVFQTATTSYVTKEGRARVRSALAEAGGEAPLAFVSSGRPRPGVDSYWGLWLKLWPGGRRDLLAHADFHGAWLEWLEGAEAGRRRPGRAV